MHRLGFALVAGALLAAPAAAQDSAQSPLLEMTRTDFKAQKTAIVTAAMQLNEQQSAAFWPVYREYDAELTRLWDRRIELLRSYGQSYRAMTDDKAKELAQGFLRVDDQTVDLREKYFSRMSRAVGPILAARFLQVENQIALLVQLQLAAELPLITKPQ